MKLVAYYHIYLTDDYSWVNIFTEQMNSLLNSKLLNHLDELMICTISSNDKAIEAIIGLSSYYSTLCKANINLYNFNKNINDQDLDKVLFGNHKIVHEGFTLHMLHSYCKISEPCRVLYFHAKGITGLERMIKGDNKNYKYFVNTVNWRDYLHWAVVDNFKTCLNILNTCDTVGCNLSEFPVKHYSGNFWWANSEYIKTLQDPINPEWMKEFRMKHWALDEQYTHERGLAEFWIGSGNDPKMCSIHQPKLDDKHPNLIEKLITKQDLEIL